MNVILASTSAIRHKLLQNAGLRHSCRKPDIDERELSSSHPDWTPEQTASELAAAKALSVSHAEPSSLVIGADQVLSHRGRMFSKPANQDECRRQLVELRGNSHQLITAVCGASNGELVWNHTSVATLNMRPFTTQFLDEYLAMVGDDCLSSVGGYQLESAGIQLFDAIDGDYFTILGLPMLPLLGFLRRHGIVPT